MRGTIRQRSKGSWQLIFDMGRDESGRRRQKFVTVRGTKAEADKCLREMLHRLETGSYVDPAKETVAGYLRRWLTDYAATNTAPKTLEGYNGIVRRYVAPAFGSVGLSKLSPQHVQGLYSSMLARGLSPTTVLQTHRVLREALSHAVKWGLLARNVADAVDPPRKATRDMTPLDDTQSRRLLHALKGSRWEHPFTVALYTGLRRSELCGLRWQDVDLGHAALSVTRSLQRVAGKGLVEMEPKTRRSKRLVSLPSTAVGALQQQRVLQLEQRLLAGAAWHDTGHVFTNPDGTSLSPDGVSRAFSQIMAVLGLSGVRLHDLRHTHATLMLKMGVHPKIVSERLGHANIGITLDTYSHVLPGLQEAAAEAFEQGLAGASAATN